MAEAQCTMTNYKKNKTKSFFYSLCTYMFFLGAPNYWFEELKLPKITKSIYRYAQKVIVALMLILMVLEWSAFLTQKNLSEKQRADLNLFAFSHPTIFTYVISLYYYNADVKETLYVLTEKLKITFNDEEVELEMIGRAKLFMRLYTALIITSLVSYGIDGTIQVFLGGGTFMTVVTAWPDVEERSTIAGIARVFMYLLWWVFLLRLTAIYDFVIPVTACLSYQYKQLCRYFLSLNGIYDSDESQEEKDRKFVEAFKIGIDMHLNTLWCTKKCETIFAFTFGGQILLNIAALIVLMSQMVTSERTVGNALATLCTGSAMLISTGCLMWTAGDVTVEASNLSTAMFGCGWQNCHREYTTRVRSLLVIAMSYSQRPVQLQCLGIVNLSYESYLSIVKSSYSVFSVLY